MKVLLESIEITRAVSMIHFGIAGRGPESVRGAAAGGGMHLNIRKFEFLFLLKMMNRVSTSLSTVTSKVVKALLRRKAHDSPP